ncbi:MAG: para-aminobenzoate synthetase component 1 [Arenicella sp.]|jgi:para-aminobenzoate synthetase component 1
MKIAVTELPYVDSAALFDKVADQRWAIFLDSGNTKHLSEQGNHANFDVMAIKPQSTLVFDGNVTHFRHGTLEDSLYGEPLAILQSAIPLIENQEQIDEPYVPGALGYFSYDLARQYEEIPNLAEDKEQLPMMAVGIYYVVLVVDHRKKCCRLLQLGDSQQTQAIVDEWSDLVEWTVEFEQDLQETSEICSAESPPLLPFQMGGLLSGMLKENMNRDAYRKNFKAIRDYTIAGDCYQVNLTKQFSAQVAGDAWLTYRYLRTQSPAPYGCYMNLPFAQILSNSPESFIQCRNRRVVTSPIKGTRPRVHHDKGLDLAEAEALKNSAKDRAENLIIVDLMRNDLSRCCELGSVKVPKLFEIHSFANVHHLISTVTGTLKKELHAIDLFRACFPGGSITGAPKIRSMEIIEELEPTRRGLYCGSIGYLGVDGSLETNIAIRTIVVKDGVVRYSAGGGLVVDSEVEDEYQELLDKARMMTEALFKNKRPANN